MPRGNTTILSLPGSPDYPSKARCSYPPIVPDPHITFSSKCFELSAQARTVQSPSDKRKEGLGGGGVGWGLQKGLWSVVSAGLVPAKPAALDPFRRAQPSPGYGRWCLLTILLWLRLVSLVSSWLYDLSSKAQWDTE